VTVDNKPDLLAGFFRVESERGLVSAIGWLAIAATLGVDTSGAQNSLTRVEKAPRPTEEDED
jgi:hypothetical protein